MDATDLTTDSSTVRLVAVDMDGTFLDSSSSYDRRRFDRLHERLQEAGMRFVVASGNQYWQLRGYFEGYPDVLYLAENGAVVATADRFLQVSPFEPDAAASALHLTGSLPGVHTIACGVRSAYVLGDIPEAMLALARRYYVRLDIVDTWADIDEDLVKLALACGPDETASLMDHLAGRLPDAVVPTSSGHGSIDLISRGVNKGVALAWLGGQLGIDPAEMVAFGDGGNDVEMLALAGRGVAMANAPHPIRALADDVTGSNDEAGVLAYLERLLDAAS